VKKVNPDNSKTIYVGGVYEVDKTSGGSVTRTVTYYPVAGAMRINSTLYYTLKDHLGSASVVADASGNILGTQRYYPYGDTRLTTGTIFTDKLFTGQREMAGLGIYHYGARFYSPKLGRFLSADTIVPSYTNPQNLNRFSYVTNNPLRYTDPTGHMMSDGDGGGCSPCTQLPQKPKDKPKKDKNENHPPINNPIDNYCGNISGLACAANFTQDIATLTDLVGVGLIEVPLVAAGCASGGPLGCAIAEIEVMATWNLTLNIVEQIASAGSFGFTLADDLINNGGWGENSSTSLATLAAGALPLTPSWDLAVDIYSSGYNHGIFNGVNTIWTDGLFK
jgi:RHS repeat-associated protein